MVLSPSPIDGIGAEPQVHPSPLDVGSISFAAPTHQPVEQGSASSPYPGRRGTPTAPSYAPLPVSSTGVGNRIRSDKREARPFYRHPVFALVVVLLAFTIIAGSISILFLPRGGGSTTGTAGTASTGSSTHGPSHTATPNLTATAIAIQNATATAHAQATATANARASATAEAQASATAGVILTATSGQPVYRDMLNDPNNSATALAGWDTSDNCVFQGDGYHDTVSSGYQGCKEANNSYTDVAVTVNMHINSGQSGGIFFRMHTVLPGNLGSYSGYLFEVNSAGQYHVLSSGDYDIGSPSILQDWTASSALRQGNATNTLQIIMQGSDFYFSVNGIYLAHVNDSSYTSGQLAFLARSDGSTTTDVTYSSLAVYQLQ